MDLMPAATAVAGYAPPPDVAVDWQPTGPLLDLARVGGGGLCGRILRSAARRHRLQLEHLALKRFLRKNSVQAVMGQYLDFAIPWIDTVRGAGCRFYAHAHGHDVSGRLTQPHWRQAYRRYAESDGVITINQPSRQALIELGIPAGKVHIVHYGVQVSDEAPRRPATPAERQVACVATGRMVPQKAPILLLDSFRRAAEKDSRLHLHYAGSGPLRPAVEQYILAFGLQGKVTLHGWQSNQQVRDLMASADLFIQHSMTDPHTGDQEGLPLAILEAMAEALPVVSTFHAGIPEAVQDGVTGFLVEPGDSTGMADRILCLADDSERRRAFGLAGHTRARNLFSWSRERTQLLHVLGLQAFAEP
jgi:glycosyltransferase involved in cell wall biosynthesis